MILYQTSDFISDILGQKIFVKDTGFIRNHDLFFIMSHKKDKGKKRKLTSSEKRLAKNNISPNRSSIDTGREFTKALKYHQSGQLHSAGMIYKGILDVDPEHSDSLHLSGVIALQTGKYDVAVDLINKAIQFNPGNSIYYNNLGNAFKDRGNLAEAISCFQKALEIKPDFAEAYYNLGNVFKVQGNLVEAVSSYQRALEFKPDSAEAYYNLGTTLKEQGHLVEAIPCFQKALEIKPDYADAYNNMGNALKDQGKLTEAIASYRKALEIRPDYAEACNNMGYALEDRGSINEAITCFQKALELKPDYAEAYYNLGTTFKGNGNPAEAIRCFQKALEIRPDYVEACNNMGNALNEQGMLTEAISAYRRALEINPGLAEVYNNMGNTLKGLGELAKAVSAYRKALEIRPDYVEACNNMGNALNEQGELTEAISAYQRALEINPGLAEVYNNTGNTLKDQGELTKAVSAYQKALEIKPDYAEAYNNMGNALNEQGKPAEAISSYRKALEIKPRLAEAYNNMSTVLNAQGNLVEAIPCFQKALEIKPDYAEAYNNMGNTLKNQGRLVEAVSAYRKALELKPDYAEAYYNLGAAFKDQGKLDETIYCFQKALELKPDYAEAYSELFHQYQRMCAWQKREDMSARLDGFTEESLENETKTPETPFASLARHTGPSRNLAVSRSWSRGIERFVSNLKGHFSHEFRRSHKTGIIIGYLSNDFRNHPMAHLTLGLYGLHNREESKIFCYSYGEDDGSCYRARILQDCDKFVDLRNLNHADAARRIYEDGVDILVDLKGFTGGSRLEISAPRPAPVQVRFLGLPGTTGADFFDYIITDRVAMPEIHAQYYSENFVYMPHCYQINDHTQEISNKDWKKSDFGLPDGSVVFCSFNQGYKIEPVMFNSWMKILHQVPEGVLWLLWTNETANENLRREAVARGIESSRLVFTEKLSKDEHLARLRLADVALDTRIVNGMITTSDALWAGVPAVTLQGGNFASRASSSMLNAIGLPELITQSLEEYESLATDLANNPDKLQEIRRKLAGNLLTGPLFDTPRFVKNLESAYKEIWKIFIAGESQRQIKVVEG